MNPQTPNSTSLTKKIARVAAVAVALTVLGCYVHDAQQRANGRAGTDRAEEALPGAVPSPKSPPIESADGFLPSSKFRAMPEGSIPTALPSSKGVVLDPPPPLDPSLFLSGSKSAVIVDPDGPPPTTPPTTLPTTLPSSKVIVMPESPFLFSSKSAAPLPPVESASGGPEVPPRK